MENLNGGDGSMKKYSVLLTLLVVFSGLVDLLLSRVAIADGFGGAGFIQLTVPQRAVSPPSPVPTLVAGSFAPKGQTPAMPSVSTEPVRCGLQLDNSGASIWGTGCNATTGFCTAPTTGLPYQPCQPPQMLFPTGGSSNGTTGQIFYTSYASFVYPVGEAIIIGGQAGAHQATQSNWNTPKSHVTALSSPGVGGSCGAQFQVVLTMNDSAAANPYAISGPNSTVYINGITSGSVAGQYQSFGWTTGNPNGQFTVVAAAGTTGHWTITYCTTVQVTGTLLLNADNYSGIVTTPYIAISSNCGIAGNPFSCQVSFLNSHTCASSCVSADTQFIAGQFDDIIINWHFGEQVPLSEQNGIVEPCIITTQISGPDATPFFSAGAELDGGTFVTTTAIADPRGTGASGIAASPRKVGCWQFNAGTLPDTEHEVSAWACPIVGYCGRLSSSQAIDAASGSSTFFKANNHALVGGTLLGITASPDSRFPVFDWTQSTLRSLNGQGSAPNISSLSISGGSVTYNFTTSPIVGQFKPGSTVGISGVVSGVNQCVVNSGSTTGVVLTLNLAGTCVIPTNSTINISTLNVATPTACTVTSGSITAGVATLNYSGSCSFGNIGAQVTIHGMVPADLNVLQTITGASAGSISFSTALSGSVTLGLGPSIIGNNFAWNGTIVKVLSGATCAGTCSITIPSLSSATFTSGGYTYRTLAGTGATLVATTYTAVPVTGGSGTGATVNISTSAAGVVTAVARNATGTGYLDADVIGVNTTGFSGLAGLTGFSATVNGGVVANLNGPCVISSSSAGQIICSTLTDASTTRVSGGSISSAANLFCAPGGNGDDPAPYDPAGGTEVKQFFPDSFQLVAYVPSPATCSMVATQTGCFGPNCGRLPIQQETLWVKRFEAGIDEREVFNSNMSKLETGSYFIWTNAGATIKRKNVWVDSWNPSAVKTGCYSSATPCGDLSHALYALQATSANAGNAPGNQTLQNLTGSVGSCLVFKNAGNISGAISLYDGEPIDFVAYDNPTINTNPNLSQFGLYWVVGAGLGETGDATGVALAATPGGPCINDSAVGIFGGFSNVASTAWLFNDVGFDHIYLACNTTLASPQVPCSTSHPETYDWKVVTTAAAAAPIYARSSYLNIGPDITNGVTHDEVSVLNGIGNFFLNAAFTGQGGRIHKTADSIDKELTLTPAVALGPTLPITNVTSATLIASGGTLPGGGTCPSGHQCESLVFPAHLNPATQVADGATFQVKTATNPLYQSVIVNGVTSLDASNWNCGTVGLNFALSSLCGGSVLTSSLVDSTTTSATIINDGATGTGIAFSSLLLTNAGLGTTNGTYTNVPLIPISGIGTGVTADITVTGGGSHIVTAVTLVNHGTGVLGNDTFTALAANIGNVSGFVTTAFAGKIIPTSLMAEFAPGTLTNTPCATDGIANDTHAFLTCLGANATTSGFPNWVGTNSTSFPLSLNNNIATGGTSTSISRNANCLYVTSTGDNPTSVAGQTIQSIIPATGGNNDVAIMTYSLATTVSYYAYNQCDTLHFQNSVFAPIGAVTDIWYDSDTISGPGPYSDLTGAHGSPNVNAAFYQTNGTRENTTAAFDGSTYAWGGHSQNGTTGCINATLWAISITCTHNGQSVLPFALGGNLNSDGTQWLPILGSFDATGANVQCAGVDCVSPASVTLKIAQGTIPFFASPGWGLQIQCNMPTTGGPPLNSNTTLMDNGSQIIYLNNDTTLATLTTPPASISGSCNVSSHPAVYLANFNHIDFDFDTFGQTLLPGFPRGAWQWYNSVIQENINAPFMGTMEGWAYQGGSIMNFALEDMNMGLSQPPVTSQFPFVTVGQSEGWNQYNLILRNDSFGTYVTGSAETAYTSPWADIYFINDSGGIAQTNFPSSALSDWTQTSFWDATANIFQPNAGETALGGMATNYAVFPTGTRSVDPATGLPNGTPSAPFYNSFLSAPWNGLLNDTGHGTQ